ncbi:uncharacterized protein LOC127545315 [Antechinus flavipes]|uniref:uncharacterized protein LOC127545315 n=1 Tax=Antechinus flavipes TaxID=38775 RepID=UPI0022359288|nr:uncharacterized protein LOC127545315 [Antechinus flavipes]
MNTGAKAKTGGRAPPAARLPSSTVPGSLGTPKRSGAVPPRVAAEPRAVVKRPSGEPTGRVAPVPKVATALSGPPRTSKTGHSVSSTVPRQPLVRKAEPAPGAGQASRPGPESSRVSTPAKQVRSAPVASGAKSKTPLASTSTGRNIVAPAEARRGKRMGDSNGVESEDGDLSAVKRT